MQKLHIANQNIFIIIVDRFIDLDVVKSSQYKWRLIDEKALDNKWGFSSHLFRRVY